LEKAVNLLQGNINPNDPESVFKKMFNVDVLTKRQDINGHIVFQLTDDDIIYLLKQYYESNPYFQEWISRDYKLKPLWKSYAEYYKIFSESNKENSPERLEEKVKRVTKRVLEKNGYQEDSFYVGIVKEKLKQVDKNQLFIKIDDGTEDSTIDYYALGINKRAEVVKPYFYVYIKKDCNHLKECIVEAIKNELS
jgi:hypothetical protein